MHTLLAATLLALPVAPTTSSNSSAPAVPAARAPAQEPNPEFDAKLAEAGSDPAKLWALHEWCLAQERRDLSKAALTKLVEVSPDHEEARKALGHRAYDGKWFESYSALSKYRREEEKRMLDEKGLVRFNDTWARPEDIPYLRMGWTKDEASGAWLDPHEVAAAEVAARRSSGGWKMQDNVWVSPDEVEMMDKGLWKCGEQWLDLAKANEFHSQLYQWWEVPGRYFVATGTIPRDNLERFALWYAESIYPVLERAVGLQPRKKPSFLVLKNIAQYNTFAAGDPNLGLPATEIAGLSSLHIAFFAEAFIDGRVQPPVYRGQGVCSWDLEDKTLNAWGPFAVRHAAAHSYLEAVDPSWETVSQVMASPGNMQINTFWTEKKIPRWMRYGLAMYCERFLRNPETNVGDEGQWAFRDWAMGEVRRRGELDPLEVIFALNLDTNDLEGSVKRMQEAGLLVSFMLDSDCAPVRAAHADFREALMAGKGQADAVTALQQALADHTAELKAYAGYESQ